jgi:hypothetical protein
MEEQAPSTVPGPGPGWYADPNDPMTRRYWDGNKWTDNRAPGAQAGTKTNGLAIASLVLGIIWLWWLGSVLALIFGYVGKSQIDQSAGVQTGRGLAIAGIVLGWIGVATLILFIVLGATIPGG